MEGLIPLVYKSLKKSHTRRKYECLSSGVAAEAYNIADFYVKDEPRYNLTTIGPAPDDMPGRRGARHWRSGSVAVNGRDFASEGRGGGGAPPTPKKQLVRFRSHRMLRSC